MSFRASILYVSSPYPGFHCRRVVDVVDVHLPTDFLQKAIHSTKELRTADSDKQNTSRKPNQIKFIWQQVQKKHLAPKWHPKS